MRRSKWIAIPPLAAVCMVVFAGAQVAQATPTWFYCGKAVPAKTGKWANSACTEAASPESTGKFEVLEGIGKGNPYKFKGGAVTWQIIIPASGKGAFPGGAHIEVKCTSWKGEGGIAAPNKLTDVVLSMSGCTVLAAPCQNGALKGVIKTEPLSGELGPIAGGSGVGLDLTSEAAPQIGAIAEFTCTEYATLRWSGSVIAEHTGNINELEKETVEHFVVGPGLGEIESGVGTKYTPLVNIPVSFEGGSPDYLLAEITEAGHSEPTGTLPVGIEAMLTGKGEALMVKP